MVTYNPVKKYLPPFLILFICIFVTIMFHIKHIIV